MSTFEALIDARAWLTAERRLIDAGNWIAPERRSRPQQVATLRAFSTVWLADRALKPSSRELYTRLLEQKILPTLGGVPLKDITPLTVRQWYATLDLSFPTVRAQAYSLLRTLLGSAVTGDLIAANPAHIRGAGVTKRAHQNQAGDAGRARNDHREYAAPASANGAAGGLVRAADR